MNLRGRLLLRVCTLLSVGTLWSALVAAQVTNGGLVGAVTDPTGGALAHADVRLSDDSHGLTQSTTTDDAGFYRLPDLPPSSYVLTVSAPGYGVVAVFAGYLKRWERWEFNAFARIDNLFDKRYIGSVIVNEGNARYIEPAPGRNWTVGMGGAYRF